MPPFEVVTLGTGSPIPDPSRAGPATLVRAGATQLLVDCGRGVLMRAAGAGSGAAAVSALLLTHLHSDHWTDLGDVITTRWITTLEPTPLPIYGPEGTQYVVDHVRASLALDVGYRLEHHDDLHEPPRIEVTELAGEETFTVGDATVLVAPTEHKPAAPSVAFRVQHEGHAVVLAGDTVPCDGLDRLCAGADVLVHTVIRQDLIEAIPLARLQDVCDYHSTVEQAAQTAARGGLKALVLTHCVPPLAPGQEEEWRSLAAAHFGGEIVVATDGTVVAAG